MNGKLRRDRILEIMKKQGYVTVQHLSETLHYSTATINRDLNLLQSQRLIKRSYGGAELVNTTAIPLMFRLHKAKKEKRKIAAVAASLVCDGDVIFIDGSTTCQYMSQYLTEIKDLTVVTSNMAVAGYLSDYGKKVICLGGTVVEPPYILAGDDTADMMLRYRVDKAFFSTGSVFSDGRVGKGYPSLHRNMARSAKKTYYLVDSGKLDKETNRILFTFDDVSAVISDFEFPDETKKQYNKTEYIFVK